MSQPEPFLGPSDHKAIGEDLIYALFWYARKQRHSRSNLKLSRFDADGADSTVAAIRETYQKRITTRYYVAYLYNVDPADIARVTRNLQGYEEIFPEDFKRALARAEEEVRKAEIP